MQETDVAVDVRWGVSLCPIVLSLRFVASEAILVDVERTDLRFERRSRDPESRGRPGRAGYAALARGERRLDSRPFVVCQFVI